MSEESTEDKVLDLGICVLVDVCHAPIIHEMKVREEVKTFLNEVCGTPASSFDDWLSDHNTGWFIDEQILKKPRKEDRRYFDEVMRIMIRTPENASYFILTFGASGISTTWGSDL